MNQWKSVKAKHLLSALLNMGWKIKREAKGSHKVLCRADWPDFVFSFHANEEIGTRMLSRIAKKTGLKPKDL